MVNNFCRRCGQDPLRRRAQAAAQAIIAQGRQAAREAQAKFQSNLSAGAIEAEEPMNRYTHAIARPAGRAACPCQGSQADTALLERILEIQTGQTQLLIDLLAAVNSLTAAVLGVQARLGE